MRISQNCEKSVLYVICMICIVEHLEWKFDRLRNPLTRIILQGAWTTGVSSLRDVAGKLARPSNMLTDNHRLGCAVGDSFRRLIVWRYCPVRFFRFRCGFSFFFRVLQGRPPFSPSCCSVLGWNIPESESGSSTTSACNESFGQDVSLTRCGSGQVRHVVV